MSFFFRVVIYNHLCCFFELVFFFSPLLRSRTRIYVQHMKFFSAADVRLPKIPLVSFSLGFNSPSSLNIQNILRLFECITSLCRRHICDIPALVLKETVSSVDNKEKAGEALSAELLG